MKGETVRRKEGAWSPTAIVHRGGADRDDEEEEEACGGGDDPPTQGRRRKPPLHRQPAEERARLKVPPRSEL